LTAAKSGSSGVLVHVADRRRPQKATSALGIGGADVLFEEMGALRYIGGEERLAQQSVRRGCHALALRGPAVAHRGRRLAELAREPDRVTP
jgi:hypothetical protein